MDEDKELLIESNSEEMLQEVSEINKMISEEKKKQMEDIQSEKKEESSIHTAREIKKKVEIEPPAPEVMERIHLRKVGDTIDILYRPNHEYIAFVSNDDEGLLKVKEFAEMSRDDFKEYLKTVHCFRMPRKADIEAKKNSSDERWYQGAWSKHTTEIFDKLGIKNPIEEPITKD